MKLNLKLLSNFIDLKKISDRDLRNLLDDLGLEVKGILELNKNKIFEIETLANRGEHLSTLGIARELSARLNQELKPLKYGDLTKLKHEKIAKVLTEDCLSYALLKLSSADILCNFPVAEFIDTQDLPKIVQVLNYLQLELGQALHAFDLDRLKGEITVETSTVEHAIIGLDGKEYLVPPDSIVIKDSEKIIAVAGIIGCENSKVNDQSKNILIESACFDPVKIRKTARKMGISTDASYAFERGVDPKLFTKALARLLEIIQDSSFSNLTYDLVKDFNKPNLKIEIDPQDVKNQIATEFDLKDFTQKLSALNYQVDSNSSITVEIPSCRYWNVFKAQTIIEDYSRLRGYNSVPLVLPKISNKLESDRKISRIIRKIFNFLSSNGFIEVITRSYYSKEDVKILENYDPNVEAKHLKLKNSLDRAYSHMKITNLLHLARLSEKNYRQGLQSVKVFEFGRLFSKEFHDVFESELEVLSFAHLGRWYQDDWRKPETSYEKLMLFKGVFESLMLSLGIQFEQRSSANNLLHPGKQIAFYIKDELIAVMGELHPGLLKDLNLSQAISYSEVYLSKLEKYLVDRDPFISDYPAIKRDLTFKLPLNSIAADLVNKIQKLNNQDLQEIKIVDDFYKTGEDFRRVSYRLKFQSSAKTLLAEDVDAYTKAIIAELFKNYQLELA